MIILNVGYLSTNYYLLEIGGSRLLVDAGWPGTLGKWQHVLRSKGVDLGAVGHFFVTHFHPDHAGLVKELKAMGLRFILLKEQEFAATETGNWVLPVKESRKFLQKIGFAGEFVHTPGHSEDSVSLLLDSGEVFIGDLPLAIPDDDNELVRQSRERLRAMGATRIYPGHGNPFELR
jgi:ribonuclease/clavin/mitogillin